MSISKHDIKARIQRVWQKLRKINPFLLALVIFLISVVYPNEYSVWNQLKLSRKISTLEKERKELIEEIEANKISLQKLDSDKVMLEKYAREKYLMRADDEDIYIIEIEK